MNNIKKNFAQDWINLAHWAPSGGNSQPWNIRYEENSSLVVFHLSIDPEYQKMPSMMDVKGWASAVALGGFFKNLCMIASDDGFSLSELHFNEKETLWGSSVEFVFVKQLAENRNHKPLITKQHITERRTDRAKYLQEPIPPSLQQYFQNMQLQFPHLRWVEIPHSQPALISALSDLQKIRWQNIDFLKSLFKEIGFSTDDPHFAEKIPLSQLALSKPDAFLLGLMSRFPQVAHFFLQLGFYRIPVRKSVLTLTNHCDRIFFIQAQEFSFKAAFELGCCFQEAWLAAQANQISFQPCGDPLIALAYWQNPDNNSFSPSQIRTIKKATADFRSSYNLDLHLPALGFRVGTATTNAPQGTRKPVRAHQVSGLLTKDVRSE